MTKIRILRNLIASFATVYSVMVESMKPSTCWITKTTLQSGRLPQSLQCHRFLILHTKGDGGQRRYSQMALPSFMRAKDSMHGTIFQSKIPRLFSTLELTITKIKRTAKPTCPTTIIVCFRPFLPQFSGCWTPRLF